MKASIIIHILLYMLVILQACTPNELTREEYLKYIEDLENGLKVEKEIADFVFSLQYKPAEYIVATEHRKGFDEVKLNEGVRELSNLQYFLLRISSKNKNGEMLRSGISSEIDYQKRIAYFSYGAQKDICLIEGEDTLQCVLYHFERSYDLAPYCNLVVGFPNTAEREYHKKDKVFSFDDKALGTGKINLVIKAEDIINIPKLTLKQ